MISWWWTAAWTASAACVWSVAVYRCGRHARPRRTALRPYIMIRPCAGVEPHLFENLVSVASLAGTAPKRVLHVVFHNDAAGATAERAARSLCALGIDAQLMSVTPGGPNRKVAKLAASAAAWPASWDVVVADSGVDLEHFAIDELLAPLGRAAASWAPVYETSEGGLGNALTAAVLTCSLHAFALLAGLDDNTFVGQLFAFRQDALAAVGGWGDMLDVLGEDMELARRLHACGARTYAAQCSARLRPGRRGARSAIARLARWMLVIRAQRKPLLWTYPALFFPLPLIAVVSLWSTHGGVIGLTAILCRLALGAAAQAATYGPDRTARHWVLLPWTCLLADAAMLLAFARAVAGPATLQWREASLRIDTRGRLANRVPTSATKPMRDVRAPVAAAE